LAGLAFGAAAFLGLAAAGAAAAGAAAFGLAALGFAAAFGFAALGLTAFGFGAAAFLGLAAFFSVLALPSFTGPEAPLGWTKSPDLTPRLRAALICESALSPTLKLAWMYFLMAWRDEPLRSLSSEMALTIMSL